MYNHDLKKAELEKKEEELARLKKVIDSLKNDMTHREHDNSGITHSEKQESDFNNDKTNNFRILLAEDNVINQDVISQQMEMLGYNVEIVDNGMQAISVIKKRHYDLILMDRNMPHMDGFSASKAIRAFEKNNSRDPVTIIALTADITADAKSDCKKVGMNDFLAKPFFIDDLDKILNKWLINTEIDNTDTYDKPSVVTAIDSDVLNINTIDELRALSQNSKRNTLGNAISRYASSAFTQVEAIRQAWSNKNCKEVASTAHSLKSSSGTLGVKLVYAITAEIESFANKNDLDSISPLILELEDKLTLSLESLKNINTNFSTSNNDKKHTEKTPVIGNKQRLLAVDDNQVTLDTLQYALQELGYIVDSVDNGIGALVLLEENRYDLVITDLQMPGMDGYGLCDAIRKEYTVEALPILVLTSTADDVHIHDAYEIGISNFIVKPVNFINLAYTILFTIQSTRNAQQLWHSRQLLEAAERTAQVSHWSWEIDKKKILFSSHLQRYFETPLKNVETLDDFISAVGHIDMRVAINNCLADYRETSWEQEIIHAKKEDSRYILHRFNVVLNENNNSVLIGTAQEISSIRHAEQRITDLAFYDTLTKLNSRSSFNKKLEDLLISAKRRSEEFAIIYLDLDNFKNINDSFGHDVGDKLLKEVANRLRTLLREADFASRLGGDEFCLLLNNLSDNISAAKIAQRCLDLLSQPINLAGREITPHASIGIATYPHDGNDANFLIKAADTAMYEAKKDGKNKYTFYEPSMTDAAHLRLTVENDLRAALTEEQFILYYQPKISLSTGYIKGVEALIRWNHPEKGFCPPDSFIPEAERMGLITEIGEWVVTTACEQIKTWNSQGINDMTVAVNISPSHFEQESFCEDIAELVNKCGVSPALIEIEITESTSRDHTVFTSRCKKLRELGFNTAIDDFGTGYSSLSVLKDAAVDVLKIDREFVRHLPDDSQSSILIGTILGMSKALGLKVVAEGIETEEQLNLLVAMGCHMAQGYYFSKPVPANEIPALTKCCYRRPKMTQAAHAKL